MKQAKLRFPQGKAGELSKFLAENGIVTNMSWSDGDGFFNSHICAIICFKDDLEDKVKANLSAYIKA